MRLRPLLVTASVIALGCESGTPLGPTASDFPVLQSQAGGHARVAICHRTGGGDRFTPLAIAPQAVTAHLRHGDALPGDAVPNLLGYVFTADCSRQITIDFEHIPGGGPACTFCAITDEFNLYGVVFSPFAHLLDVTDYEEPEVASSHALGLGLRGASDAFEIGFGEQPIQVNLEVTSNNAAPPLAIAALDVEGMNLAVSEAAMTYVTRFGFLFRRVLLSVESGNGVATISLDRSSAPLYGYDVDNLTITR